MRRKKEWLQEKLKDAHKTYTKVARDNILDALTHVVFEGKNPDRDIKRIKEIYNTIPVIKSVKPISEQELDRLKKLSLDDTFKEWDMTETEYINEPVNNQNVDNTVNGLEVLKFQLKEFIKTLQSTRNHTYKH